MAVTIRPYWARALHRLRSAVAVEEMSGALREASQARIMRYREHQDAAAVRAKYRSASFRGPIATPVAGEGMAMNYRAMMLDGQGRIVRTETVTAAGDDEAAALAARMVDGHAVDLWDGLRFIEHFDPAQG